MESCAAGPPGSSEAMTSATRPSCPGIAYMFSHDKWYEGTVMRVPWLPGHKWEHWRRVQFDDGDTLDVDTTLNCALTDGRAAVVEARDFLKTIKSSKSQTVRVSSKKSRALKTGWRGSDSQSDFVVTAPSKKPPGKGKGKGKGKGRGRGNRGRGQRSG